MSDAADWRFGVHAVEASLAAAPRQVRRVLVAEGRRRREVTALLALVREAAVRVERVPRSALQRRAKEAGFDGNHQGVAAERHALAPASEMDLEARWASFDNPLLVVLDGIADPRNLGACLRTADAAGADAVVLPKRGSAPLSSAAAKAASGAMERLMLVEVGNLARFLPWLRERGVWLVGGAAAEEGAPSMPYTAVDYRAAVAIVVGGEAKGLRRLTRERCDRLASIPMAGSVESLNVSVALGVLLFEALRQRREAG